MQRIASVFTETKTAIIKKKKIEIELVVHKLT